MSSKFMVSTRSVATDSELIRQGFHALSEPLRLQIVNLLKDQEFCVCDLTDRLQISQSKLSFHLKILKEASLIRSRQHSRWIYYRLNIPQFVALEQFLVEFCYINQISSQNCQEEC